jgi:ATP-dependent protease Clp ATPase subunit
MEGAVVRLGSTQTTGIPQTLDTTNILFICAGAFVGLEIITATNQAFGFISV